ncbi:MULTISPECIES: type II toxin-antitoxin system RelE/ParE family toxin [unclassified Cryobacterium]|uniref:type II toxin-antitoxin system RelE family toxin n=1 Tax=unclassified Cryobacterium TaxID=2649013 RepID=UPI002AB46B2F|nr:MULTISPECIES: type II toxin-antitoxin system RelE/ParE family toxin [unclassified Cryobacterium]MDY7542674.1 type II toxin-antitoxin system RelE/ParE family toxin [Cryobacterium sp. 5B3]MEB0264795.1 type II toxin-antitoxin system RelE/ParE family toxin [Cryobacterium sp. 10I5]MEB0273767.1 type II toxin-antitoxin system RelE/ParE family toxin [Cryobacterium sp. 5B3]
MTSRWRVETTEQFDRQFKKLDRAVQRRVLSYLEDIESLEDPRQRGKGLTANHSGVWRYRIGDYRVLVQILDDALVVLAVNVDHRKDGY